MWEFFRCLFTSCLQITVCFLMQYFEIYQPKTIIYSNFLGILNKIPFFWICFTILRFLWNKNVCSILCKYKLSFLFFPIAVAQDLLSCTYCTNSALCHRSWLWMSLLLTSKGLFVLYVATVNQIIWYFSHDCNINLKFEFNFQ